MNHKSTFALRRMGQSATELEKALHIKGPKLNLGAPFVTEDADPQYGFTSL